MISFSRYKGFNNSEVLENIIRNKTTTTDKSQYDFYST